MSGQTGGRYDLRSRSPRAVICAGSKNRAIWSIHHGNNMVRPLTEIAEEDHVFGSGVCALPDDVIEGGGLALTGGEKRSACTQFHFGTSVWSPLPELSAPRWGHGSVCVRSTVFAIGGSLPRQWTGSVEYLNIRGSSAEGEEDAGEDAGWQAGPSAPESLYCPKVARIGEDIYVLDDHTGKLFCLDPERGEWGSKKGLGATVAGTSLTAAEGKLYLAGGRSEGSCRTYDLATDAWHTVSSPGHAHCYGSLLEHGRHTLLLAGGNTDTAELYDVTTDTWKDAAFSLPDQTSYGHAFVISG